MGAVTGLYPHAQFPPAKMLLANWGRSGMPGLIAFIMTSFHALVRP